MRLEAFCLIGRAMNNKEMGGRIKTLRLKMGLSQAAFAQKTGISIGGVCELEKGKMGLQSKTISRICKSFNIDPAWLLFGDEIRKDLPYIIAESRATYDVKKKGNENDLMAIAVINDVPAGYPEIPALTDEPRGYVYIPRMPKGAFGLFVQGKSMEPDLVDGDIVIVDPTNRDLKKGDLGVFRINNEATVKKCVPLEGGGYILQPSNPAFSPIVVAGDTECESIGKVICKIIMIK